MSQASHPDPSSPNGVDSVADHFSLLARSRYEVKNMFDTQNQNDAVNRVYNGKKSVQVKTRTSGRIRNKQLREYQIKSAALKMKSEVENQKIGIRLGNPQDKLLFLQCMGLKSTSYNPYPLGACDRVSFVPSSLNKLKKLQCPCHERPTSNDKNKNHSKKQINRTEKNSLNDEGVSHPQRQFEREIRNRRIKLVQKSKCIPQLPILTPSPSLPHLQNHRQPQLNPLANSNNFVEGKRNLARKNKKKKVPRVIENMIKEFPNPYKGSSNRKTRREKRKSVKTSQLKRMPTLVPECQDQDKVEIALESDRVAMVRGHRRSHPVQMRTAPSVLFPSRRKLPLSYSLPVADPVRVFLPPPVLKMSFKAQSAEADKPVQGPVFQLQPSTPNKFAMVNDEVDFDFEETKKRLLAMGTIVEVIEY